jgi:hypothetical protein
MASKCRSVCGVYDALWTANLWQTKVCSTRWRQHGGRQRPHWRKLYVTYCHLISRSGHHKQYNKVKETETGYGFACGFNITISMSVTRFVQSVNWLALEWTIDHSIPGEDTQVFSQASHPPVLASTQYPVDSFQRVGWLESEVDNLRETFPTSRLFSFLVHKIICFYTRLCVLCTKCIK